MILRLAFVAFFLAHHEPFVLDGVAAEVEEDAHREAAAVVGEKSGVRWRVDGRLKSHRRVDTGQVAGEPVPARRRGHLHKLLDGRGLGAEAMNRW